MPPESVEEEQVTPNAHGNAAEAAAAAEGLTLCREAGTQFGYYGVSSAGARFKAQVRQQKGQKAPVSLGRFDSPEEAALAIATLSALSGAARGGSSRAHGSSSGEGE